MSWARRNDQKIAMDRLHETLLHERLHVTPTTEPPASNTASARMPIRPAEDANGAMGHWHWSGLSMPGDRVTAAPNGWPFLLNCEPSRGESRQRSVHHEESVSKATVVVSFELAGYCFWVQRGQQR